MGYNRYHYNATSRNYKVEKQVRTTRKTRTNNNYKTLVQGTYTGVQGTTTTKSETSRNYKL